MYWDYWSLDRIVILFVSLAFLLIGPHIDIADVPVSEWTGSGHAVRYLRHAHERFLGRRTSVRH